MTRCLKRSFDLIVALVVLISLSPLILILAILIRINLGSPILFVQERPGLFGKSFFLYKFRSMRDERDANGELLPDRERLGRFGAALRAASLDELPQLFNVIKGEMALVGPRPLLVQYLPLYSSEQKRRHDVRPGITGWAQINGRNNLTWKQKFDLDVWYVDNWSLALDLKILYWTVKKVLVREGVSKDGQVTTEPFDGTN